MLTVTGQLEDSQCVNSMCLLEATLKASGPFYLVSMPEEVKGPTDV